MMGRTRHIPLLVLIAFISVLAGFLTAPPSEAATQTITLRINPGTAATTANLNCGWHSGACPSNPGGVALDWDQSATIGVYLKTWARYTGSATIAGTAQASQNDVAGFCRNVRVPTWRPSGTFIAYLHFTHSKVYNPHNFQIPAGSSFTYNVERVATTLTAAEETCGGGSFTGPHLHQAADSPYARHSLYPDAPASPTALNTNQVDKWQNAITFQY